MTDLRASATVLINKFGKEISYSTPSGTAMNDYGDDTDYTWGSPATTKAIVSEPDEESLGWQREGGVTTGRLIFYLPYDETIEVGDKISYNSIDWLTEEVLKYQFFNKYACLRVTAHRTTD